MCQCKNLLAHFELVRKHVSAKLPINEQFADKDNPFIFILIL